MSVSAMLAMQEAMEATGWALLSLGGVVLSVLCSGCEMGVYAVNRVRLHVRSSAGTGQADRLAVMLNAELREPGRVLGCLLVGNNIANWCIGMGLTALLTGAGYSEGAIVVISALVLTPVLFVVCDALPKEVFRASAETLMYAAGPFVRGLRVVMTYSGVVAAVHVAAGLVGRLARAGGEGGATEAEEHSARARMAVLLKESAGAGAISEQQAELLDRAFKLRSTRVGDEMVPWSAVRMLGAGLGRREALMALAERGGGWSRYPLVTPRGEVVGVLQKARLCVEAGKTPAEVAEPVVRLSQGMTVREALAELGKRGAKMGVVYEGERPVGIVTAKDLVEPLTGELKAW